MEARGEGGKLADGRRSRRTNGPEGWLELDVYYSDCQGTGDN